MSSPSKIGLLCLSAGALSQHWLLVRFDDDGGGTAHCGGFSGQFESEKVFTSLCSKLKEQV